MNRLRGVMDKNNWLMGIRRPEYKIFFRLAVILLSVMTACKTDSEPSPWFEENSLTISQYLDKNQEEYSKFYRLLVDAKMLHTLYAYNPNGKDWTLFLPTDEAIDQFIQQNPKYSDFEELEKDTLFIKKLTRYHILKKSVRTNDFPDGAFIDSTLTGDRLLASFFAKDNNQLIKINNAASIVKSNLPMTNGYIHVISEVLQPAEISGYDWLQQQSKFSILAKAMELSGIKNKINWNKYTLFAESDSVYNLYGIHNADELVSRLATPGLLLTNKTNAFYLFTTYHILSGEYYMNDFYWGVKKYQTFSGQQIEISVGQDIKINTGVDTYGWTMSTSGINTAINYISPISGSFNYLTRTGPVHSISDLLYYLKLPKEIKKDS